MSLVVLENVYLAYGHHPLLDHASLSIEEGERVCLIGRNGAGKSSLMRLVTREIKPDGGEVRWLDGLRVACLPQEVPHKDSRSVYDVVAAGLAGVGKVLADYHRLAAQMAAGESQDVERLADLQHELEAQDGWNFQRRVEAVLSRLELSPDAVMSELSGGYKRRALLAQALVCEPDLLLLDEPTNHLDVEGIQWLEDFLASYSGAVLFVTHDRAFLQRVATRIVELDRGQLLSWPGTYDDYLRRKEAHLAAEADQNAKFDKKLAQEEVWIRQGIKARRTRNEGRVRALKRLREERAERRNVVGGARMGLDSGAQSGQIVVEVTDATVTFNGRTVIDNFSTRIMRGDRVGIIGPNGAGKTTLLKLLLGELQPDSGTVQLGTKQQVAYFDQQREQLDPEATVLESLNLGKDTITINGQERHVMGYLQDFLFVPARVRSPVKALSGGERNRLLLARLFSRPANVLVLDEPTNDLDMETLDLLEELLGNYPGTILLVSHDRAFLDNVVMSTLVFEGRGRVAEYVGGYTDWLRQRRSGASVPVARVSPSPITRDKPVATPNPARKLSYKEQRELESLPAAIEALEAEQATLTARMNEPGFYQTAQPGVQETLVALEQLGAKLTKAYARWEELEASRVGVA